MVTLEPIRPLLARLADVAERPAVAARLTERFGASGVAALVVDAEVQTLVPAPGFPRTLPGGPEWRALLQACAVKGLHRAMLPYGEDRRLQPAVAIAHGSVLICIGGEPSATDLQEMQELMPLIDGMLRAEQAIVSAAGEVKVARDAVTTSERLTALLDRNVAETARLNRELSEADERKNEFLAMLGHELRNPLAAMVLALRVLGRECSHGNKEVVVLNRQLSQLTRIVDDLLDVSRITRGSVQLQREPCSVQELVSRAIETASPGIELRGHALSITMPQEPVWVNADPVRMVQVLGNLLHNAAKYTEPRGRIAVLVETGARLKVGGGSESDELVHIHISDNGTGISEETLPRVFELFVQAPRALARSDGGLGIGLRVVQSLVELHGGKVSAHSDGLGQGSTFTVSLPVQQHVAVAPAAKPKPQASPAKRRLRLLVVDDNVDAAESLGDLLEMEGHTVQVAHNGLVALRVGEAFQPDVALLDIGLPDLDGYEVARRLRMVSPSSVLVALTGYSDAEKKAAARDAGIDDYLVKPIDLPRLEEKLEQWSQALTSAEGRPSAS